MSKVCMECGQKYPDDMNFCTSCGSPLKSKKESATSSKTKGGSAKGGQASSSNSDGVKWGLLSFLLVLVIGVGAGIYFMLDSSTQQASGTNPSPKSNKQQAVATTQSKSTQSKKTVDDDNTSLQSSRAAQAQQTTKADGSSTGAANRGATVSHATYVSYKNQYDHEISALASDVNSYLGNHSDFKGDNSLLSRAEDIRNRLQRTKEELKNANVSNTAIKGKLLEVFDLELGRINGLLEGIRASKQGGSYSAGFKRGGEYYDRYEQANATLNKML